MELLTFIRLFLTSRVAVIAENLFLRKQLALFQERKAKPRRTTASFRLRMVALARFFVWRDALVVVKPETFLNGIGLRSRCSGDGGLVGEVVRRYRKISANWSARWPLKIQRGVKRESRMSSR
jgi:hypothetical protein